MPAEKRTKFKLCEKSLFPVVVVEEAIGGATGDPVGDEERFDRGEARCGVGTPRLAARIGRPKSVGETPRFESAGELLFHFFGEAPGAVDQEKPLGRIGAGEGRRSDFEEEIAGEIGKGILRIGEEEEIGSRFEPREGTFF